MEPVRYMIFSRFRVKADTGDEQTGKGIQFGTNKYFFLCGIGGVVSCGSTHLMITPMDVVKCRLQVNPMKYKSLINGFKVTIAEEGVVGLTRGWLPTFLGYSVQGFFKFGLYEYFKVHYSQLLGDDLAFKYRTWIYLMGSASAEFFADIGLAPFEACKVKIQTTQGFTTSLTKAAQIMISDGGVGVLYTNLVPLWLRQIPYTMMKFTCFEKTLELLYRYVVPKPREECGKGEQLVTTFAAGYIAGVLCAVVSHPADSVVSKMSQEKGASAADIAKRLGWAGMWKGLFARIIMIGTLTGLQWFVYDAFKVFAKMPRPPPAGKSN